MKETKQPEVSREIDAILEKAANDVAYLGVEEAQIVLRRRLRPLLLAGQAVAELHQRAVKGVTGYDSDAVKAWDAAKQEALK